MYEMEDVPTNVWDEVYKKWAKALQSGWYDGLWSPCALCHWIEDEDECGDSYIDCDRCPLMEDEWCTSSYTGSKLCIGYDDEECDDDDVSKRDRWRERVIAFLEFIKPYCSSEVGENDD